MPVELYYAPIDDAATTSLDDLLNELTAAGLPCKIEPEAEDMFWILLDGHESTLFASVTDGQVLLATFAGSLNDETAVMDKLDEVMRKIDYSAGDGSDLADLAS